METNMAHPETRTCDAAIFFRALFHRPV